MMGFSRNATVEGQQTELKTELRCVVGSGGNALWKERVRVYVRERGVKMNEMWSDHHLFKKENVHRSSCCTEGNNTLKIGDIKEYISKFDDHEENHKKKVSQGLLLSL